MSFFTNEMLAWLVGSALGTWLLAHAYLWLALRSRIVAVPNERSAHSHVQPTPTAGGVSFLIAFCIGLAVLWMQSAVSDRVALAWLGPVMVGIVGFMDDLRPLPVHIRTPAYFAAATWCIYWLGFPALDIAGMRVDLGVFGLAFGVLSLAWLQNLYNFMDGIDGLAISESAFACIAALVIGNVGRMEEWNAATVLLCGTSLGFAIINWPKAKVFMGDVGSAFVGLGLGVLSLGEGDVSVWTWMILLAYFLTDACLTISIRMLRGDRIHESHSLHAYQHLSRRFGGKPVLIGVLLINTVWLYPLALASHIFSDQAPLLLVLASVPLLIGEFCCGAGQLEPRLDVVKP